MGIACAQARVGVRRGGARAGRITSPSATNAGLTITISHGRQSPGEHGGRGAAMVALPTPPTWLRTCVVCADLYDLYRAHLAAGRQAAALTVQDELARHLVADHLDQVPGYLAGCSSCVEGRTLASHAGDAVMIAVDGPAAPGPAPVRPLGPHELAAARTESGRHGPGAVGGRGRPCPAGPPQRIRFRASRVRPRAQRTGNAQPGWATGIRTLVRQIDPCGLTT
jgi:hypothetical protein